MSKQASKKSHKETSEEASNDPRTQELLSRVATDPKFILPGKSDRKVQIDDRFKEMFYSDKFKVGGRTNKKSQHKEKNKELADFYYTKDEEKEKENSDDEEGDKNDKEIEEQSETPSSSDYEDGIGYIHITIF